MAGRMFVRQIADPMEYRGVYRSGSTLMLAEDYLQPVATAKSVGGRHNPAPGDGTPNPCRYAERAFTRSRGQGDSLPLEPGGFGDG